MSEINPNRSAASRDRWDSASGLTERRKLSSDRISKGLTEEFVISQYSDGKTIKEIAAQLGIYPQTVHKFMKKRGIPRRSRATRHPRTEQSHHAWKGDRAGYNALHNRLHRRKGLPQRCEVCGTNDPSKTYDWANLTGNYSDIEDYRRMCRKCHRSYDASRRPAGWIRADRRGSDCVGRHECEKLIPEGVLAL